MTTSENSDFNLGRIEDETFVAKILYRPTLDSTNNAALELAQQDDLQTPLLVLTSHQTCGRGRGSNRWWSAPGALTFSLLIRAEDRGLPQELWPRTSLTTGLAICTGLDDMLPESAPALKWPNDVLIDGRKVCGILVETEPSSSDTLVLGIGVNVNNSFGDAPDELKTIATSLHDVTGQETDLTDVLVGLLRQLEVQLSRLSQGDPELVVDWQTRCALRGRTVEVQTGTPQSGAIGFCQGIDEDGALVLLTDAGPTRLFGGVVVKTW